MLRNLLVGLLVPVLAVFFAALFILLLIGGVAWSIVVSPRTLYRWWRERRLRKFRAEVEAMIRRWG